MRWRLLAMVLLTAGFFCVDVAEGRVGGGQGFSGGSSGGGGGGGDGEILVDIFLLLLHLCIEYPQLGCPLMTVFLIGVGIRFVFFSGNSGRKVVENRSVSTAPARVAISARTKLLQADGAFSETVFLDFAALVHRRALAAGGDFSVLGPFVSPEAQAQLSAFPGVEEVVVGSVALSKVSPTRLQVDFTALYVGQDAQLVESTWVFRRPLGVLSRSPEAMLALACPSCGNPAETTSAGACVSCGSATSAGQLEWQAVELRIRSQGPPPAPALGLQKGGIEASAKAPTRRQERLAVQLRKLVGRHPDFDKRAFKTRVEHVYHSVQEAWSEDRWQRARPFLTDLLFQQLRFWVEGYRRRGLRNQLTDVQLKQEVQIVKVEVDAWYEAITVRIWGSMKDSVVDGEGKVVAGNDRQDRVFSEYWTFLRAAGTGGASSDPASCPSCGAPADDVGSNGVCGYCDAKLSSGRFDWVLARIEQPEAYRG